MDDRHPKRRKDKYNPYTLSMIDGKCYLSFRDGQGVPHRLELDVKLYAVFDRFELGLSSNLKAGYSAPAATGMPSTL